MDNNKLRTGFKQEIKTFNFIIQFYVLVSHSCLHFPEVTPVFSIYRLPFPDRK